MIPFRLRSDVERELVQEAYSARELGKYIGRQIGLREQIDRDLAELERRREQAST